jgi:hypothetical protein
LSEKNKLFKAIYERLSTHRFVLKCKVVRETEVEKAETTPRGGQFSSITQSIQSKSLTRLNSAIYRSTRIACNDPDLVGERGWRGGC